jgi:toxin YhaV
VSAAVVERNGWKLYRSAAFADALDGLVKEVAALKNADPDTYRYHPKTKLLARLAILIFDEIPRDPNANEYSLGNTLGKSHRHWRRAKFFQRFRLFFRFDSASKIIVYAWVNDENTLRKAGARSDPYSVFLRRLASGNPPDDWQDLLKEAQQLRQIDT